MSKKIPLGREEHWAYAMNALVLSRHILLFNPKSFFMLLFIFNMEFFGNGMDRIQ
jgi:hypothetical protein